MKCPRCGTDVGDRFAVCPVCLLGEDGPPDRLASGLELIEEIGRGGMGTVYRARDPRLDRTVAVKFVTDPGGGGDEARRRFEREARALARLSHPAIVAVHGADEEDGHPYIVMEHVVGRSLAEALPVPEAEAVRIAIALCDGLAYAHREGVVHRDVKPSNVLLDRQGHVKITDFGIARLVGKDHAGWTVTDPAGAVGTPYYMAPETLAGAAPDPRMDVYSTGVVLYELVTGRLPQGTFEPLREPLDRVVRRALAPDPDRRYATADEMRADLQALTATEPARQDGDERNYARAVAMVFSLATAVALWAFLLSVTPRVVASGDVLPLIMIGTEHLPDGRAVSRARFETLPTLGALAAIAVAIAAYGLLRRHWRDQGSFGSSLGASLPESRVVLWCGGASAVLYAARLLLETPEARWVAYVPIVGGILETGLLFFFWVAVLEAWRTRRPLAREVWLWVGSLLGLLPPVADLLRYLRAWRP